mmetsp:Transcript_91607/g.255981  ORF Transcript_91607/g.255981 Transcript_91607/m.255981 type:complete len:202 (+) Transcript_91607:383-988(+)
MSTSAAPPRSGHRTSMARPRRRALRRRVRSSGCKPPKSCSSGSSGTQAGRSTPWPHRTRRPKRMPTEGASVRSSGAPRGSPGARGPHGEGRHGEAPAGSGRGKGRGRRTPKRQGPRRRVSAATEAPALATGARRAPLGAHPGGASGRGLEDSRPGSSAGRPDRKAGSTAKTRAPPSLSLGEQHGVTARARLWRGRDTVGAT